MLRETCIDETSSLMEIVPHRYNHRYRLNRGSNSGPDEHMMRRLRAFMAAGDNHEAERALRGGLRRRMRKLVVKVDDPDDPHGDKMTAILVEDIPAVLSTIAPPYNVDDRFEQVAHGYLRQRCWVWDIELELLILQAFFRLSRKLEIGENAADKLALGETWEYNDDSKSLARSAASEPLHTPPSSAVAVQRDRSRGAVAPMQRVRSRSPRSSSFRSWSRCSIPPPPPPDPRRRRGK